MDPETVSAHEARDRFRDLLDSVEHKGAHVVITRYDRPAAVIVSAEWYEQAKAELKESEST